MKVPGHPPGVPGRNSPIRGKPKTLSGRNKRIAQKFSSNGKIEWKKLSFKEWISTTPLGRIFFQSTREKLSNFHKESTLDFIVNEVAENLSFKDIATKELRGEIKSTLLNSDKGKEISKNITNFRNISSKDIQDLFINLKEINDTRADRIDRITADVGSDPEIMKVLTPKDLKPLIENLFLESPDENLKTYNDLLNNVTQDGNAFNQQKNMMVKYLGHIIRNSPEFKADSARIEHRERTLEFLSNQLGKDPDLKGIPKDKLKSEIESALQAYEKLKSISDKIKNMKDLTSVDIEKLATPVRRINKLRTQRVNKLATEARKELSDKGILSDGEILATIDKLLLDSSDEKAKALNNVLNKPAWESSIFEEQKSEVVSFLKQKIEDLPNPQTFIKGRTSRGRLLTQENIVSVVRKKTEQAFKKAVEGTNRPPRLTPTPSQIEEAIGEYLKDNPNIAQRLIDGPRLNGRERLTLYNAIIDKFQR